MNDADAADLSAEGKFEFAYNAVRSAAKRVVRASGYRVKMQGGNHVNTFMALEAADPRFAADAAYFDTCREKRNDFSYDVPDVITDTEADELKSRADAFVAEVETWLQAHHPQLA